MATGAATPLPTSFSSCSHRRPAVSISSLLVSYPKCPKSHPSLSIPHPGLGCFSPWSGLKHLGISRQHRIRESKGKCQGRVVYASLFGVGAPEALVIGVVALLVFGPKGLAEVARNLGKTLRAFQPTIRELQEVSREFKSTLEREIGLDEVASSANNTYKSSSSFANEKAQAVVDPNGVQPTTQPYSSEELLKITEEQLTSSATTAQAETTRSEEQAEGRVPPTTRPYSSEELLKITEEQLAFSETTVQAQATSSEVQSEVAPTSPNVAATTTITEVATQTPMSEKPQE